MDRVLVVASHPDDEVLGVGGTIQKHRAAGDAVTVLIAAECERPASMTESYSAERVSGVPYIRLAPVAEVVKEIDPAIVYTHSPTDLHHEHRSLHEDVLVACRPYSSNVKSLRLFETPSATDWGVGPFIPNLFVDISPYFAVKAQVMAEYVSELMDPPHPRSIGALLDRAAYWGQQINTAYAEAFVLERGIE